jgi:zinc D-Ala-D-Ala dipeptidase
VPGYREGSRCVLKRRTANALAQVAADLAPQGYGLKVFDCYRPIRAVSSFMAWTRRAPDAEGPYHPGLTRADLVPGGYIAAISGHSRGNVVDLTLVRLGGDPVPIAQPSTPCAATRTDGRALDLGTDFDCFSRRAHLGAPGLSTDANSHRRILTSAMERRGFQGYAKEWWHFTFQGEMGERYDFPVPRKAEPTKSE